MGHGAAGNKKFKSSRVRESLSRAAEGLPPACICGALEVLESRLLMSTVPNVVTVNWNGKPTRVFQDEYVVALKGGADIKKLAAAAGFDQVQSLGSGTFKFHYAGPVSSVKNWGDRHADVIDAVEPDLVYSFDAIPNDPLFPGQYYLQNTGQTIPATLPGVTAGFNAPGPGLPGADIQATDAWDLVPAAKKSVVAVLDSGIDQGVPTLDVNGNPITIPTNTGGHPDLINNIFINQTEKNGLVGADNDNNGFVNDVRGWDFFRNDNVPDDELGHGTEVSGVIAGQVNNQLGIAGVADNTTDILPLKVGGLVNGQEVISSSSALAGISYATAMKRLYIKSGGARGANVIVMNASFGGQTFPFDRLSERAIALAGEAGILLVTAAGNSDELGGAFNVDTTGLPDFPAKFSLSLKNVITVAATDQNDQLASFSSTGVGVQLAAPGVNILTTTFTPGTTGTNFLNGQPITSAATDGYGYVDGTSFSSPIVAGILALEYAAKPSASAADLKNALLKGVDVLPSLSPSLNVAPPVSTRGRANAYKAVRDILNEFVQTDVARSGSWHGVYGRDGAFIAGDTNPLPPFVQAGFNISDVITPVPSTSDPRALQNATKPGRVVGYLEDPNQISFDLNFNDNQTHRVSFYAVDFEHANRSEQIEIVDTRTGATLDSRTISNFGNGQYFTYDLTGGVTIRITKISGPDAVLSGIFFDPTPVQSQDAVRIDPNTQGNYIPVYGSVGSVVVGDRTSLPSSVIFGTTGATERVVVASTTNKSALVKASNPSRGQVSYLTAPKQFNVNLNFRDPSTGLTDPFTQHRVSLYALDFDNKKRTERIEVYNKDNGALLASQDITDFSKGKYVTFDVQGNVSFHVINIAGPSAVISGVFLDATPGNPVVFVGQDNATRGNWMGKYGAAGSYVVGNSTGSPKFLGPIQSAGNPINAGPNLKLALGNGGIVNILEPSSSNSSALQKETNPMDRIVGYFQGANFTLDLNVNDQLTHRVSLYFLDFDKQSRVERVQIIDPRTGNVITQRTVSNFTQGTYVTYDITGPVRLRFTRLHGPNAVLSGVFFD
jgi:hypothetical protein